MTSPTRTSDTIYAPATAPGRAAIAIVRLSGPDSRSVCRRLTGRPPPEPRRAALRRLVDPGTRETLDLGLVLWFPAPASVTGEDVLEFQVHGGRAVLAALLDALAGLPGLRPAEPGEFTKRAFLNERLDLTAAEGLADLVAAETRAQARQAWRQLDGELGRLYEGWRETLLDALARVEAEIDFAPEEEVPDEVVAEVRPAMARLATEIATHLADEHRGQRLREGLTIAVVGPPNAGKSSLVNCLARRDVAIVTEHPGTTRDVLEVDLDLGGYPVTILDTAGLREAAGTIEAEGVRRARERAGRADLRLLVLDGATWPEVDAASLALAGDEALIVVNKADLDQVPPAPQVAGHAVLAISCRTAAGLGRLLAELTEAAAARMTPGDSPMLTRSRHRAALTETLAALRRVAAGVEASELALVAEDLRLAARGLGRITGRWAVEEILDRIFAEFCIGK